MTTPRRFDRLAAVAILTSAFAVIACSERRRSVEPPSEPAPREITIAAASDLKFALDDVIAHFERANPGAKVKTTYGSSGALFAQIENGAPFDLFLSADVKLPQRLVQSGAAAADSLFLYGIGRLAVWVPAASPID